MNESPNKVLLEPNAAKVLGVPRTWLREQRKAGKGPPFFTIGTAVCYNHADIVEFAKTVAIETQYRGRNAVSLYSSLTAFVDNLTDEQVNSILRILTPADRERLSTVQVLMKKEGAKRAEQSLRKAGARIEAALK